MINNEVPARCDALGAENMADIIQERGGKNKHKGCSRCIVCCSNEFINKDGKYVTSSLEYETIWAVGAMCGIDDLDTIAKLDFMCDDIGLDTINTGVAIAVAMDAGWHKFGDGQAAIDVLEETAKGTKIGCIMGNGPAAVGSYFRNPRVPVCKNQSIAAYDPRAIQGQGVTYATSPMGADYTAGNMLEPSLRGSVDPLTAEGQVETSRKKQIAAAVVDCTGLCSFVARLASPEVLARLVNARWGTELSKDDVGHLGAKVIKAEIEFNRRAGITKEHDRLAKMFYEEPLPPHGKTFLVGDADLDTTFGFLLGE
ncbi:MAG: aldehyde ferredoxin oxidoreductase C-terminal domain-containing protein [Deltaproteobacteria bacterium]|nr:aldehyde ferredoxin oxidoreductase C-terminal domain-containing protein [Deltaproteobacteria bacterium]